MARHRQNAGIARIAAVGHESLSDPISLNCDANVLDNSVRFWPRPGGRPVPHALERASPGRRQPNLDVSQRSLPCHR